MTNERAIQLLHRLQDEQFDGIHGDERREALDMAVRALEVVHCSDCKFGDWYTVYGGQRRCYCTEFGCGGFTAEDFCSRGKPYGGESE